MNVDEPLFQPLARTNQHGFAGGHPRVHFTPRDCNIELRTGVAGDEFGIVHADEIRENPAGDVHRMSDRLAADTHAGRRAQFFQITQTGIAVRNEQIVLRAVGRPQINEPVDIILHSRLAQHRVCDQRSAHTADGQPVGLGDFIDVIRRLPSTAGRHILHDDGGIPRDMLAQKIDHGPCS